LIGVTGRRRVSIIRLVVLVLIGWRYWKCRPPVLRLVYVLISILAGYVSVLSGSSISIIRLLELQEVKCVAL
jgi:hypothetical protein